MRDFYYWLDLTTRRRTIFLEVAGLVLGFVIIGTLLWPPVYESTAEILVQDNRAQYLVSPDIQENTQQKPPIVANPVSEEDLNSERELVTSLFLVRQAIADLHTPTDEGLGGLALNAVSTAISLPSIGYEAVHGLPATSAHDEWAMKLENHLNTEVIKRSDVIEVDFTSHDQRWSQEFLSRLINQYLAFHAQISHDPQAEHFFTEKSNELETQLRSSEDNLREFQVQSGITDMTEQTHALIDRVSQLKLERDQNGAQASSAQQEAAFLTELLQKTPEHIDKETRKVQNLALSQLKPQVMAMKSERAELLSRYQPTSQRIREIDAKLDAAQKILEAEDHLEVQETSTDLNPVWVTIESDLSQANTQATSAQAAQGTLSAEISQGEQQLTQMVNAGVQLDRLQRKVETNKEAYMAYVRKAEEARAAQGLNANKILNVSIAQEPMLPIKPKFPIVWLNLAAGFVLAGGLGVAAAYWEEAHDPILYSPFTIAEAGGLSTVAVIRNEV